VDTSGENLSGSYVVLRLVQGSGERLPCLVETETWIPARVATRWAVRYRRYKVQSSTLMDNLRVLRRIYEWAATVGGFELDNFLTSGKWLNARQIESLATYLRTANRALTVSDAEHSGGSRNVMETIDASTFDHQLSVAENFLKWSLDSMNRRGVSTLTITELGAERLQLELLFKSLRIGARPADRREPLEEAEISAIRHAIGPQRSAQSGWVFSNEVFAKGTKLRNWLMFETALNLGLRRGELLKLRVDCLPRGSDDGVRLLRLPDDPRDSRARACRQNG
jgi:integrase